MQKRYVRYTLLTVLIVIGIGTGSVLWYTQRQSAAAAAGDRELDGRLDAMLAGLTELGSAQQAYVAPGQAGGPWLTRASSLLQRLRGEIEDLRPYVRSGESARHLETLASGLGAFAAIDKRIRGYLGSGEEVMAADLAFSEGVSAIAAMSGKVRVLRSVERTQRTASAQTVDRVQVYALGGGAALWLVGLLLLVRPATASSPAVDAERASDGMSESPVANRLSGGAADTDVTFASISFASPAPETTIVPIDLVRAADVCAELAGLNDAAHLQAALSKAAEVLDAVGIIIWLGAGEQLHAVASHGYDPRLIARLGPIDRKAEHATADCWRQARLGTVTGDAVQNGAIVAPMIGLDGCRGVLAIEVRGGRESDPSARAVASMFASQLAAIVVGWPAAGAAPEIPKPLADERLSSHA